MNNPIDHEYDLPFLLFGTSTEQSLKELRVLLSTTENYETIRKQKAKLI